MYWETVFGVLSIIIAIACGVFTWCSLIKDNAGVDHINPLTILLISISAAALGYFYGFFALFVYLFMKVFMFLVWCIADIVDFIYVAYFSKEYNSYKRKRHVRHARKRLNGFR